MVKNLLFSILSILIYSTQCYAQEDTNRIKSKCEALTFIFQTQIFVHPAKYTDMDTIILQGSPELINESPKFIDSVMKKLLEVYFAIFLKRSKRHTRYALIGIHDKSDSSIKMKFLQIYDMEDALQMQNSPVRLTSDLQDISCLRGSIFDQGNDSDLMVTFNIPFSFSDESKRNYKFFLKLFSFLVRQYFLWKNPNYSKLILFLFDANGEVIADFYSLNPNEGQEDLDSILLKLQKQP